MLQVELMLTEKEMELLGDEWEVVRVGRPREGEDYISDSGTDIIRAAGPRHRVHIIVRRKETNLPPCPDGDGWIEWSGGECPVPPTTNVDVQLRNGDVTNDNFVGDSRAEDWFWETDGGDGAIIRYRVHQPKHRLYNDSELMALYTSSTELIRKDKMGGGRVDSWTRILGKLHIGISGDPCRWSAKGLQLYWEHVDGSPCEAEMSE